VPLRGGAQQNMPCCRSGSALRQDAHRRLPV